MEMSLPTCACSAWYRRRVNRRTSRDARLPLLRAHVRAITILTLATSLLGRPLLAQPSGPDTRPLTDPRSITSPTVQQAQPVSIADFFYTRSTSGASWSPDGKEIAFTTDLAGQ